MFINVCFLHIYLIHVVKKNCACILVFALSPLSLLVLFYHSFNFFGMPPALACMKKSNITNMPTLELPPSHSTFATLPRFGLFIRVEKSDVHKFSKQDPFQPQCRLKRLLQDLHRLHRSQLRPLLPSSILSCWGDLFHISTKKIIPCWGHLNPLHLPFPTKSDKA